MGFRVESFDASSMRCATWTRVSPRTVNKYLPRRPRGRPRGNLRWLTFLRLHAHGPIACNIFVAVTAIFAAFHVMR